MESGAKGDPPASPSAGEPGPVDEAFSDPFETDSDLSSLDDGDDVDAILREDKNGHTPMQYADVFGHQGCYFALLLASFADKDGHTPMHYANAHGQQVCYLAGLLATVSLLKL